MDNWFMSVSPTGVSIMSVPLKEIRYRDYVTSSYRPLNLNIAATVSISLVLNSNPCT